MRIFVLRCYERVNKIFEVLRAYRQKRVFTAVFDRGRSQTKYVSLIFIRENRDRVIVKSAENQHVP